MVSTASQTQASAWDQAADGWNSHATQVHAWLAHITKAMIDAARIEPGWRVLDVAAGSGGQTLDIARRVGAQGLVLATDISPRILVLAQQNAAAAEFSQVQTRVADAQALGLAGSDFDAAVCRLGLMFCPVPLSALMEICSALKPGGHFAAVVFSTPQSNPCVALMMATALKAAGVASPSPYTPGSLLSLGQPGLFAQLLDGAGFVDIDVQPVSAPFELPSAKHYVDFVRASGSPIMEILAPLSALAQTRAWDEMTTQLEIFLAPKGWIGPNELLLCSARRAAPANSMVQPVPSAVPILPMMARTISLPVQPAGSMPSTLISWFTDRHCRLCLKSRNFKDADLTIGGAAHC